MKNSGKEKHLLEQKICRLERNKTEEVRYESVSKANHYLHKSSASCWDDLWIFPLLPTGNCTTLLSVVPLYIGFEV